MTCFRVNVLRTVAQAYVWGMRQRPAALSVWQKHAPVMTLGRDWPLCLTSDSSRTLLTNSNAGNAA